MNNEFQIFEAPLRGVSLVEASAGTGKTYNIASLFVRTILEKELMPANILVLTYTEAATAELKKRLRARIKESIKAIETGIAGDNFLTELITRYDKSSVILLTQALYRFDEAQISTIHGFCQRMLSEQSLAFDVSSDFEILPNSHDLLLEITDEYWRSITSNCSSDFSLSLQEFLTELGYSPDKLLEIIHPIIGKPYIELVPDLEPFQAFLDEYERLKTSFFELKTVFESEAGVIREVLRQEVLNKRTYNRNKFIYLDRILNWLNSEIAQIKPVEKLEIFSSDIYQKVAKGESIPELRSTSYVDIYLNISDRMQFLEQVFLKESAKKISLRFEEEKSRKDVLTYDDLLIKVSEKISNGSTLVQKLRERYPVALIDEFQDTDPIQYSIFNAIYPNDTDTCLFMIGDPKQAIYSFRGADIHTYLRAKTIAGVEQTYSLFHNYRSSRNVIQAINSIFSCSPKPFILNDLEFTKAGFPEEKPGDENILYKGGKEVQPLQFIYSEEEGKGVSRLRTNISNSIASEIVALLTDDYTINGERVKENDIAVLVRKNFQATEIQQFLRQRGIKSIIKSQESVFQTRESSELYIILSSIFDGSYEAGIRAALATEMIGYSAKQIYELYSDEGEWGKIYLDFIELKALWKEQGFSILMDEISSRFNIDENLGSYVNSERRITNLYHLIELLKKEAQRGSPSPFDLISYFKKRRIEGEQAKNDEELVRLESDDELVQIITSHTSKGLEYPIVFCPYLWEGLRLNDQKIFSFHNDSSPFLDIGTNGEQRIMNRRLSLESELAENIRLAYVSLTRAKSACIVYLSDNKGAEFSALASLVEGSAIVKNRISDKLSLTNAEYKKNHSSESFKMIDLIRKMSTDSNIGFREPNASNDKLINTSNTIAQEYSLLDFTRDNLFDYPRVTSFSSLQLSGKRDTAFLDKEGFDYDEIASSAEIEVYEELNQFNLPKGANTGLLLHSIFEEIVFNNPKTVPPVVESLLSRYGFDPKWNNTVTQLVYDSLNHNLKDGLSLGQLEPRDCLVEMEFHFPVERLSLGKMMRLIRNEENSIHIDSIRGFMKGFIDLIFKAGDFYYILDYKSNFLGGSFEDYNLPSLGNEIVHSNYDVQYYIYTTALHRLLSKTVKDYSYEKNFGGVFYFFLKGIEKGKEGSGVFFDKPDSSVIFELNDYFERGEAND